MKSILFGLFLLIPAIVLSQPFYTINEVDEVPQFPGGIQNLFDYLNKHSDYPCTIIDSSDYPPIIFILKIDKGGGLVSLDVEDATNGGFENALKYSFPYTVIWKPAVKNNMDVGFLYRLEIYYVLSNRNDARKNKFHKNYGNEDLKETPMPLYLVLLILFSIVFVAFFLNLSSGNIDSIIANISDSPFLIHYDPFPKSISPQSRSYLLQNFKYYKKLSPKKQKVFENRIIRFLMDKNIEGRKDLSITPEMKLLIAAIAVQLTFGLRIYKFPTFTTIVIYPDLFKSARSKTLVKGETHSGGYIALSWKYFLFGISDDKDNLNLGFHEFAHALFIERVNYSLDSFFNKYYDAWRKLLFTQAKMKEARIKHTFRDYSTHNEHEFFAVSVENFFENPEKYKQDLPELYRLMTKMLNQDPLAKPKKRYNRESY